MAQLRKLSFLKLDELILRDNPLVNLLKDEYLKDVRTVFPALQIFDNSPLPQLQTEVSLPTPQFICCRNMDSAGVLGKFVNEYFSYFDVGNVSALGGAYHNDAILTLSVNTYRCKGVIPDVYVQSSRNMKFYPPNDRRKDNVTFCGRNSIVDLLKKLPLGKHTAVTFDMNMESDSFALFTVTGDLHDSKANCTFLFIRTYCVVPSSNNYGLSIMNEQITICKSPNKKVVKNVERNVAVGNSPNLASLTTVEMNMVSEFSRRTGMILQVSLECLIGNKWDAERALMDFNNLKAANKIPQYAFIS